MLDWPTIALGTFVSLLPIVDPFGTSVLFLSMARNFEPAKRRRQAFMACVYMVVILCVFLIAGAFILRFFGISLPGVRIAGGLIIARIGFDMLNPERKTTVSDRAREEASHKPDIAFSPLAMPLLSGPGSIAVTVSMATRAQTFADYAAICTGILLVAIVSWLMLRGASRVVGFFGESGTNAMSRIMGFLLICVGIQFVVVGIHEFVSDEAFLRPILDAIRK